MDEAALHGLLFGARPYAEVVLAEVDGRAIGLCAVLPHGLNVLPVSRAFTSKTCSWTRKRAERGYGKGAHGPLGTPRRGARCCARFEWAVLDWNEPSIAFYQQLGAKPLDTWHVYRLSGAALHALGGQARAMTLDLEFGPVIRPCHPTQVSDSGIRLRDQIGRSVGPGPRRCSSAWSRSLARIAASPHAKSRT